MQIRHGHTARFSPTRSHTQEPAQVPRRGHQCQQQQLRPDRQVLGPIRRGRSFRSARCLTKRWLETALFTAPAGNSPLS